MQLKWVRECLRPIGHPWHWVAVQVIDGQQQVTLIQGPPGTGKTTTAIAIICEWIAKYSCKVLATAHSNKGVRHSKRASNTPNNAAMCGAWFPPLALRVLLPKRSKGYNQA
jgi:hypothetical protein